MGNETRELFLNLGEVANRDQLGAIERLCRLLRGDKLLAACQVCGGDVQGVNRLQVATGRLFQRERYDLPVLTVGASPCEERLIKADLFWSTVVPGMGDQFQSEEWAGEKLAIRIGEYGNGSATLFRLSGIGDEKNPCI